MHRSFPLALLFEDPLDYVLTELYKKAAPAKLIALREKVASLAKLCGGQLSIGTGCSGTDVVVHVAGLILKSWHNMFGIDIKLVHALSCENTPFKQEFIAHHFDPGHIFPDLHQLNGTSAMDIHGALVAIPLLHIWVCGIECDSISALNTHSHQNKSCIEDDGTDTRTGNTARSCMQFIKDRKPMMFILENVKNLAAKSHKEASNLETLIKMANRCGYYVSTSLVNTSAYGFPQARERFYIVGARTSQDGIDQFDVEFKAPEWAGDLQQTLLDLRIDPMSLGHFLLPDDHIEVLAANTAADQASKTKRLSARRRPRQTLTPLLLLRARCQRRRRSKSTR